MTAVYVVTVWADGRRVRARTRFHGGLFVAEATGDGSTGELVAAAIADVDQLAGRIPA